jgi:hypothetical protein
VGTGAGAMPYAYDALNAEAAACFAEKLVQAITTNAHDLSVNGHLF